MAILTKAYASLVGLKFEYHKVNLRPDYLRHDIIILFLPVFKLMSTHLLKLAKINFNYFKGQGISA
jgi:hypothetical protein